MRLVHRYLLKDHPNQSQGPAEAVSASTLERDYTKHSSASSLSSHTNSHNGYSSMYVEDSSVWRLACSSTNATQTSWKFGLARATGIIQVERLIVRDTDSQLNAEGAIAEDGVTYSLPTIRIKVVPPRWLSYKAFDIMAWKARIGWRQHLRVRNVFPASRELHGETTPFGRASNIISSGSLSQLRSQLENQELTPWDEDSDGKTLLSVSSNNTTILISSCSVV